MDQNEIARYFDTLPEDEVIAVTKEIQQKCFLEPAAAGIARQLCAQGRESLSLAQKSRFLGDGWIPNVEVRCVERGCNIPHGEMVDSRLWWKGRCGCCQSNWESLQGE